MHRFQQLLKARISKLHGLLLERVLRLRQARPLHAQRHPTQVNHLADHNVTENIAEETTSRTAADPGVIRTLEVGVGEMEGAVEEAKEEVLDAGTDE